MHPFEISVQELFEIQTLDKDAFILDVREAWEIKKAALQGFTHIPLSSIPENMAGLSNKKPLYVLCHHGVRSLKVALFLREEGFEAYSVRGGVDAWAREMDSSVGFY
ncbi:rhodanese-like domain-containing protein [Alphaproteobacteria bacterium]|nr:rhodanese-like domain-containing protein [Alphaproteobacteria bacterium]